MLTLIVRDDEILPDGIVRVRVNLGMSRPSEMLMTLDHAEAVTRDLAIYGNAFLRPGDARVGDEPIYERFCEPCDVRVAQRPR